MTRKPNGPDPIDVAVGARIRIRRRWLNKSQSALAEGLDLTFQQVQKYERGTNRVSASMLVRIAALLDCSGAYLLGEDGATPGPGSRLMTQFTLPGADELLAAYESVTPDARRSILSVAQAIAGATVLNRALDAA